MDEPKTVPLKTNKEVIGTATVLPDGDIKIEFDTSPSGVSFYEKIVTPMLKHRSIQAVSNPKNKE